MVPLVLPGRSGCRLVVALPLVRRRLPLVLWPSGMVRPGPLAGGGMTGEATGRGGTELAPLPRYVPSLVRVPGAHWQEWMSPWPGAPFGLCTWRQLASAALGACTWIPGDCELEVANVKTMTMHRVVVLCRDYRRHH